MDNDRRIEIARRNQLTQLEASDYKAMMLVFGIQSYSAVANIAMGTVGVVSGTILSASDLLGIALGAIYATAAYATWFKSGRPMWLGVLPSVIAAFLCARLLMSGAIPVVPILLNGAALILIVRRTKVQRELAAMRAAYVMGPSATLRPS